MTRAAVVVGEARYNLLPSTGRELTAGLRDLGIDAELLSFPDPVLAGEAAMAAGFERVLARLGHMLDDDGAAFVVDMNCRLKYSGLNRVGWRRFSYVTDAPWSQFENIADVPADTVISFVDRHHDAFHRRFFPGRRTVFMPHGGPVADQDWHDERPIDVLFLGNLSLPCRPEHLEALTARLPLPIRRSAHACAARITEDRAEPFQALLDALADNGLSVEALGVTPFMDLLRFVCRYVEYHGRYRLLTSLGRVPITVAGGVAPGFFHRMPENLRVAGIVDEDAAMALIRRSRILLNSVSVFPGGSHERVWYGMALGAALCTEPSTFLDEDFSFGPHLLSVDEAQASDGESLCDALAVGSGVLPQARAAGPLYRAGHTWRHRAAIIAAAMA